MIIQLNVDEGLPRASARSQRVIHRTCDCGHVGNRTGMARDSLRAIPREPLTKLPMKNRQNNSRRASALQNTLRVTLFSLLAGLLMCAAAPQTHQKPPRAGMAVQTAHPPAAGAESAAATKVMDAPQAQRAE